MSWLRKLKRLVGILVSTPTLPADPVQNLKFQRNPRALAVSPSAISPPIDPTLQNANDGATVRDRNMDWGTAYASARMAVEIAKETSDLCPPLKAVVGAMSVLMAGYDVSVFCSQPEHLLICCLFPARFSKHRITRRV